MIDDKREDESEERQEQARTFTEEQSAIFSNPHGTPEAARARTPGTESVPPTAAEPGGGAGAGDNAEEK